MRSEPGRKGRGESPMTMETAKDGRASNRKTGPLFVDASALAAELRKVIRGEVRFDAGSRALYATDGSNYRQVPIGVVIPRDVTTSCRRLPFAVPAARRSSRGEEE